MSTHLSPASAADVRPTTARESSYLVPEPGGWTTRPSIPDRHGRPVQLAWLLGLTCMVRMPPTSTLYAGVLRVPPLSTVELEAGEPRISLDLTQLHGSDQSADPAQALRRWCGEVPSDAAVLDDGTMAAAAVASLCSGPRHDLPASGLSDLSDPVDTDRAGLPVLPGHGSTARSGLIHATIPEPAVWAGGLRAVLALGREEVGRLADSLPPQDLVGWEMDLPIPQHKGIRSWFRKKRVQEPYHETGRLSVPLPPWFAVEALDMLHAAGVASNASWGQWFDQASPREGRIGWALTDPEQDGLLGLLQPSRDPDLVRAAVAAPPRTRARVVDGSLFDHWVLRTLAAGHGVVDEEALVRRQIVQTVVRGRDAIRTALRNGWFSDHGLIYQEGLDDLLSNPFTTVELAQPLLRTVRLDSWLQAHDPEIVK